MMKNFLLQNLLPYMGNKADNLSFIDSVLNSIVKKDKELQNKIIKFADLFSGSGVVSRLAKSKGYSVFANDLELYAKIVTEVPIRYYEEQVERIFGFVADKLKIKKGESNYLSVIEYLNGLKKVKYSKNQYFTQSFAPNKREDEGYNRFYYSPENAAKIDAIIEAIFNVKIFSKEAREIILASLVVEMLKVVNNKDNLTRSFSSKLSVTEKQKVYSELELTPIVFMSKKQIEALNKDLLTYEYLCEAHQGYAENVLRNYKEGERFDFVYLDPPYNQQQYGNNYSLLISACKNDKEEVDESKKFISRNDINESYFCKKTRRSGKKLAQISLEKTLETINSKYIIYSYTPNSVLTISEILETFSENGNNHIQILFEESDEVSSLKNQNNTIEHCLFVIQKNKRQYSNEIEALLNEMKSKSIVPENEDFKIRQSFLDVFSLTKEKDWRLFTNSIQNKYRIYHGNKFIFEVNFDLMVLIDIDTNLNAEEKELINKYLLEESEVAEIIRLEKEREDNEFVETIKKQHKQLKELEVKPEEIKEEDLPKGFGEYKEKFEQKQIKTETCGEDEDLTSSSKLLIQAQKEREAELEKEKNKDMEDLLGSLEKAVKNNTDNKSLREGLLALLGSEVK